MKKLYWETLYRLCYFILCKTYYIGNPKLSMWVTGIVLAFTDWNYKHIGLR